MVVKAPYIFQSQINNYLNILQDRTYETLVLTSFVLTDHHRPWYGVNNKTVQMRECRKYKLIFHTDTSMPHAFCCVDWFDSMQIKKEEEPFSLFQHAIYTVNPIPFQSSFPLEKKNIL